MMERSSHRLHGLEPDNLLAFLALLGTLQALESLGPDATPRVYWDLDNPPLRPVLTFPTPLLAADLAGLVAEGTACLSQAHDFSGRLDLDYSREEARLLLSGEAAQATRLRRSRADLTAALMCDAAIKDKKNAEQVDPTPLCLLFGQGHQHFLERLAAVPAEKAPPSRGRGKSARPITAAECLHEALFEPWHRNDPTFSFRWDPAEDVRYAMRAGNPTASAYKSGTQHGANRLASLGIAAITLVPQTRAGRIRPAVLGGQSDFSGFSFAWPIWRAPATLPAVRAMLAHPGLREEGALRHLGVDHVLVAKRISVGKFMNFTRARVLS
jgi:hypothetical protein